MTDSKGIPAGITRAHILKAIEDLNKVGNSTGYDLFFTGKRYAPKAVVGLAAEYLTGTSLGPYDFKGGLNTLCFRVLQENGFSIILKSDVQSFPEEIEHHEIDSEGSVTQITVNRYERDASAKSKALKHYGTKCQVCSFDFFMSFGEIGAGFIDVHHIRPLSQVGREYLIDPIRDLRPVCPNCHAMLHRQTPPYTMEELPL